MHGATVTKLKNSTKMVPPEIVTLTPERATELLEHNTINRPLLDQHVRRIAGQIMTGKWRFNGDTIKISDDGAVLDGQHRLWAIIEARTAVETILVYGIKREAFSTIDTLRKPRSGSDVIALSGTVRHRNIVASSVAWLIRFQRNGIEDYKAPQNRVENSDIEAAFAAHPGIVRAVERAMTARSIGNPSITGFLYYLLANHNPEVAERLIETLRDPGRIGVEDPFFRLRAYFTADHHKRKEPVMTIALAIKACNAAALGKNIKVLSWRNQGENREAFPKLEVPSKVTPR
jgi:hypothetical protein